MNSASLVSTGVDEPPRKSLKDAAMISRWYVRYSNAQVLYVPERRDCEYF